MSKFKAGDAVYHRPSKETWTVAAVNHRRNELVCCGWPESIADFADCDLETEATAEDCRKMLEDVVRSCGHQLRGSWARANLAELDGGKA